MSISLIAAAAVALLLPAPSGEATVRPMQAAAATAEAPSVAVTRQGDVWTADFDLRSDAPVWAFRRSALTRSKREPWRMAQWRVESPGVVLERQGGRDILRAADGGLVPRRVRIVMSPAAVDLEAEYDPALVFTDGSVALFSGHFDVFPLSSPEAAAALPHDLVGFTSDAPVSEVTMSDPQTPLLLNGARTHSATVEGAATYAVFGPAELVDSAALATVIDNGLPAWIAAEIGEFAPRTAGFYASRLGPGQTEKPTVMASWNGPTEGVTSMGGSVLPGLIVMAFEGEGVVEHTPEVLASMRWFIGHESSHFWLGHTVRYASPREAWITEGGADLMAIRALEALDPAYDGRTELQKSVDDCARLTTARPLATANERGEHRAYYACGAVFALTAEALQKRRTGGDWFDVLATLIESNREDGVLAAADWLGELTRLAGDEAMAEDIARFVAEGSSDPMTVIAGLFDRSGVAHTVEAGRVRLT